jgi:prephenate dehydrogenase
MDGGKTMDDIREILKNIQENMVTKSDIEDLKKEMARHDDVMAMVETMENITTETAAALENKQESNDVLLKSLIDGLESRQNTRLDRIESSLIAQQQNVNNVTTVLNEGFKMQSTRFDQVFDIMRAWVSKQTAIEEEIKELKRKIEGDN